MPGSKPMTITPVMLAQHTAANQVALMKLQQTQMQQWQQQWQAGQQLGSVQPISSGSSNYIFTTTGDQSYNRECEVSKIVKRTKNGYFFVISVDSTDDVWYRVWKGGWFPYMIAKWFKRFRVDIDGSHSVWNEVTQRTHLPATLGAAYEKIDEAISADRAEITHNLYIKEMLTTDPENLKMIGGLEKLAEGDGDAPEEAPNVGSSHNVGASYSNNAAVSPASQYIGPGTTYTIDGIPNSVPNSPQTGSVTTLSAENSILNETDMSQVIEDHVQTFAEEMKEHILAEHLDP